MAPTRLLPTTALAMPSRSCGSTWKRLGCDQKRYAKPAIAVTVSLLETIGLLVAALGKKVAVTLANALTERDIS